jgi:hypothetical protein
VWSSDSLRIVFAPEQGLCRALWKELYALTDITAIDIVKLQGGYLLQSRYQVDHPNIPEKSPIMFVRVYEVSGNNIIHGGCMLQNRTIEPS